MPENKKTNKVAPGFNPSASQPVFSWQSPEFVHYKKNWKWFAFLFALALVLAGIFYWQKQVSSMIMVLVAGIVFAILSELKPKNVRCAVYHEGVVAGDKVYTFGQFKSFWINGKDIPKLKLQLAGRFAGQATLPMKDQDLDQIRLFVSKYLPEDYQGEDLIDSINSFLRF